MNPSARIARFHRVKGGLVETMLAGAALTSKVKLGKFSALPFFNGAFDWQGNSHHQALHVGLDFVQMLFAEMLHCVSHWIRLKDGHSLEEKFKSH